MNPADLMDVEVIGDLMQYQALVYLLVVFVVFYIGKMVYDLLTPFNLNEQLTEVDNKAVAVSFAGYMFGIGIILWGVLSVDAQANNFVRDLIDTAIWGAIGIVLLQVGRFLNDKIILYRFDNTKELVTDKNVGTGAVEAGSFIGTALIVAAAVSGEDTGFVNGLLASVLFFVLGQIGFIIFGLLYQKVTRFDLHDEIEKDNVSAGLAFGMTLITISMLLSDFILKSESLPGFGIWFVISAILLLLSRVVVDKIILPGSPLDEEVSRDRNWGAALIEGGTAIAIALLITAAF